MMTTTHSVLVSISTPSILSPIVLRSVVYGNLKFSWNGNSLGSARINTAIP